MLLVPQTWVTAILSVVTFVIGMYVGRKTLADSLAGSIESDK